MRDRYSVVISLDGQRVWLTGASTGIGRAMAFELGSRGARLALTARNEAALDDLANEIATTAERPVVVAGDVTDASAVAAIGRTLDEEMGGVDMLIANAGTHVESVPESFDTDEYLGLMDLNYGGVLRCIEAVLPRMLDRRVGRIVGVASLAGYRGLPRAAAYCASKSALITFLQSLRFHMREHGVGVTVVNPGFVRTPLTDKNDFRMPFLMEADDAARVMCKGLERERDEIAFPIPFSWCLGVMRILPRRLYELVVRHIWKA